MPKPAPPWEPKLFGLQRAIYHSRKRIVLADGSRASGKTHAVCHKVVKHLTETPGADVGAFATSIKASKDCGSWQLIHKVIIPEWLEAGLMGKGGKPITYLSENWEGEPGPKRDSITRTEFFDWRNQYGGTSTCSLFSINNLNDIAAIVKQKNFSMVWLMELSTWKKIDVMYYTLPCLRMKHLLPFDGTPQNCHQWIADTNPDEEEGANSWFYKFFYQMRNNPPTGDSEEDKEKREWLSEMEVFHMHWRDNPHVTKQLIRDLKFACQGDQALLDSHFHGIHGVGGYQKEYHFKNFFVRPRHVIGGGEGEDDQIEVSKNTVTLYGGWDMGGSVNHAFTLLEKRIPIVSGRERVQWNVLDELVIIGEDVNLDQFTNDSMAKMESVEAQAAKKFHFVHWSDDTAINVFRSAADTYDYLIVKAASMARLRKRFADKEITREQLESMQINLQGVSKPQHSRKTRVRIIRQLLHENRLFVASRCVFTIAMLENLRKTPSEYIVHDEHVHPFDSLSYPIYAESQGELMEDIFRPLAVESDADEKKNSIVSV